MIYSSCYFRRGNSSEAAEWAHEYPFRAWALGLVGARTESSSRKGADRGIDGRMFFHDSGDEKSSDIKQVVFSVKAGKTGVSHVRDLRGVVDREKAAIGVLITMQEATEPMRKEAASAGFYVSPGRTQHARLQLLTIEELLGGKKLDVPMWRELRTFKRVPKASPEVKDEGASLF